MTGPGDRLCRMIDANANRAREGARVLEDLARFALDDEGLGRRLRALRHGITATLRALPFERSLLSARDSAADVGREDYRGAGTHSARGSARDLVAANAARVQEALRVLEECLRVAGAAPGSERLQALRFEAYRLERELGLRFPPARALPDPCLYVILTAALARGSWEKVARLALEGGATALQLREKDLSDREFLRRAELLRSLTRRHGALFFVNDRVDVARAAGADGVHLGPDDLPLSAARMQLGPDAILGATCHTFAEAEAARAAGANYVSMGPVFSAATKFRHLEARGEPVPVLAATGLAAVRRISRRKGLAFVAIGGIDARNVKEVLQAGARRIAVCAAVIASADPRAAAKQLVRALAAVRRVRPGRSAT